MLDRRHSDPVRIAIAAVVILFAACHAQPRGLSLSTPTTRASIVPYGVAALDGSSIYVINDRGLIDAVDTRTGATRWTSASWGEPLLVVDGMLFALVDARVVVRRETSPAIVWSSDKLPAGQLRSVRIEGGLLKAQLMAIWGGSGMRQCGEEALGEITVDLRSRRVSHSPRNAGPARPEWQQESTACNRADGLRVKLAGNIELRIERERDLERAHRGPNGSSWLPRRLVATELDGERVRWTHAVPSMDVTPWQ